MNKINCFLPIIGLVIAISLLLIYSFHFKGTPLSDSTSDWGAWGSYVGIGVSILSVFLIYITYKEQQESNRIGRFEEHFHISLRTSMELFEKRKNVIDSIFNKVENHFRNSFDPLMDYEQSKVQNILGYYYSSAVIDCREECEEIFRYFFSFLLSIKNNNMLDDKEKESRFREISCLLPENGRILFLCWGFYFKHETKQFYNYGLYQTSSFSKSPIMDVVKFACVGKRPKKEHINVENLELEDYSSEEFQDTYKRLFNNKTKQQ